MKAYIIYERLFDSQGEFLLVGGIETYLMSLAKVFLSNGIQPEIIQKASKNFVKTIDGIKIRGFKIRRKTYKNLYKSIATEINEADFVVWGLDRCAVPIPHERTISIQHGIPFDYYQIEKKSRQWFYKLGLGRLLKTIQRRNAIKAFETAKYKVCVDYNFWNWYRTYCMPNDESNIYIIPNFAKVDVAPNQNHKDDKIKVVFARRFVRMRGIEAMLKVAAHYHNNKNVEITFAGEGPFLPEIESLKSFDSSITITKYSPEESIQFHKQFDIAIVPSVASEGTSLSLLEAMSAGTAVIATYVGGMTNIIIDGYNGLFVRPNSHKEIIYAIDRLASDRELLETLSRNGVETVKNSFSFETWSLRWTSLINDILSK